MTDDPRLRGPRGSARVPNSGRAPGVYRSSGGGGNNPPPRGTAYGRGGQRPPRRGGSARPRWGRIALVGAVALSVIATVIGIGLWSYANGLNDDLNRVDAFAQLVGDRPVDEVDGDLNILVVGSDSRSPDNPTDGGNARTDTIMLMHIPASHDKAYIVSIPRDLYVSVPKDANGNGGEDAKINASFAWGGVPLLIQTVENYTNVRIDHVVEIDFSGLKEVVDALGGVEMNVEQTIDSIHKPYRTFEKGVNKMNGEEALDYVRQRYQFSDGDFARMRHQQQLIKAIMDKATSMGVMTDPSTLNGFLKTVIKAVRVDENFNLLDVAIQFRNLRSADLVFLTSPNQGTGESPTGESIVVSDDGAAAEMYAKMRLDSMAEWVTAHPEAVKKDK
ncbi:transcriptional regulator [Actinorhabdospora filicis]|uniref:Transcriptional regulator n=1 Tax=Actinorhabdospora filicis TaxID=1785913 RepID=A0A9W6ST43_9ACTN|nr:LCP family protein [Actinorhabdospora filicis]GLZ81347.1 transcriptional regulator [Actinorhabdospora filicis]